jgi:Co/Zn/Cd efflux system component
MAVIVFLVLLQPLVVEVVLHLVLEVQVVLGEVAEMLVVQAALVFLGKGTLAAQTALGRVLEVVVAQAVLVEMLIVVLMEVWAVQVLYQPLMVHGDFMLAVAVAAMTVTGLSAWTISVLLVEETEAIIMRHLIMLI